MSGIALRFEPSGREIVVQAGTRLFDAVRAAHLPLASSCKGEGTCGRCALQVEGGRLSAEQPFESAVKVDHRVPADMRLACMCRILEGPLRVRATYW